MGQDRVASEGPPIAASPSLSTRENGGPALAVARSVPPYAYFVRSPCPAGTRRRTRRRRWRRLTCCARRAGRFRESAVATALGGMTWPARVEVVARRPAVVLDAAHNVASVEALVETLRESFDVARRILIFGTTQDKDVRGMLACLLEKGQNYLFDGRKQF